MATRYVGSSVYSDLTQEIRIQDPFRIDIIDDAIIKGGYRVVRTEQERDFISCKFRKPGMRVMVIGEDYSFKDYMLKTDDICENDDWVLVSTGGDIENIQDNQVLLEDDYSSLGEDIETQQDLNNALKAIIEFLISNPPTEDKNYVHDQFNPATVWNITHNLGKKPSVSVVDTAGTVVEGMVDYLGSTSQLKITFNYPFSGYATLN